MVDSGDGGGNWRDEFAPAVLAELRSMLPEAIHAGHERSAESQVAHRDPKGRKRIYGVGVADAVPDECQERLATLAGYKEKNVPHSSRVAMHLGPHLIHIQRVGEQMPGNHKRIRLKYLSESRKDEFDAAGNSRYVIETTVPLFVMPDDERRATLDDALEATREGGGLMVAYYSSTPFTVGHMYLAPARLEGKYLVFADPEPLVFRRTAQNVAPAETQARESGRRFAVGERPRTTAKLRNE